MLETIIKLLERFVVAHELIAENSKRPVNNTVFIDAEEAEYQARQAVSEKLKKELPVEDVIDTKPKKTRAKKGPDLAELRDEIKTIAKHIAAGDDDKCAGKFDDLLDAYKVRTVTKLDDEDVADFHADAKALVAKYYEIEE